MHRISKAPVVPSDSRSLAGPEPGLHRRGFLRTQASDLRTGDAPHGATKLPTEQGPSPSVKIALASHRGHFGPHHGWDLADPIKFPPRQLFGVRHF